MHLLAIIVNWICSLHEERLGYYHCYGRNEDCVSHFVASDNLNNPSHKYIQFDF